MTTDLSPRIASALKECAFIQGSEDYDYPTRVDALLATQAQLLELLRDECAALRADAERLDSFERMDLSLVQREPGCWSCAEGLKDHVVWATSPRAAIDAIRKGMVGALAGKPPAARATGAAT